MKSNINGCSKYEIDNDFLNLLCNSMLLKKNDILQINSLLKEKITNYSMVHKST